MDMCVMLKVFQKCLDIELNPYKAAGSWWMGAGRGEKSAYLEKSPFEKVWNDFRFFTAK